MYCCCTFVSMDELHFKCINELSKIKYSKPDDSVGGQEVNIFHIFKCELESGYVLGIISFVCTYKYFSNDSC